MITCKISIDNNTKDHKASMMAEETDIWLEVFDGRDNLLNHKEDVVRLVSKKCNIFVLSCKRPKPKINGGAREVGKWCLKLLPKTGSAPKHP